MKYDINSCASEHTCNTPIYLEGTSHSTKILPFNAPIYLFFFKKKRMESQLWTGDPFRQMCDMGKKIYIQVIMHLTLVDFVRLYPPTSRPNDHWYSKFQQKQTKIHYTILHVHTLSGPLIDPQIQHTDFC